MSSYTSGIVDLADSIRTKIRNHALHKLELASHELEHLENALAEEQRAEEAERNRRENLEAEKAVRDEAVLNRVKQEEQKETISREMAMAETEALLEVAQEQAAKLEEGSGEKQYLLEKIGTFRQSVDLFGLSLELADNIRKFTQNQLPEMMRKWSAAREQERMEKQSNARLRVRGTVVDNSRTFVSMNIQTVQTEAAASPWEIFVERLQSLAKTQSLYDGHEAEQCLNEIRELPPERQNAYMMMHRKALSQWEAEAASFAQTVETAEQQKTKAYDAFQKMVMLCGEEALAVQENVSPEDSPQKLERMYQQLLDRYIARKEQQYIEHVFQEVFAENGIAYESMHADEEALRMTFEMQEGLLVSFESGEDGAFGMEVYGVSDSAQVSREERRHACEQTESFCKHLPQITEALRERGIVFEPRTVIAPSEESMRFVTNNNGSRRVAEEEQKRTMKLE